MSVGYRVCHWLWRQRWLPRRSKKLLYKQLCDLGPAPSAPFTTRFFGLDYRGNLNNNIEFNIYYYGAFEKPLLFFLRDCLAGLQTLESGSPVFYDVGANIGQHSLFMSRYADQVHAFEPYEPVRKQLAFHLDLNQIPNIQLHALGLSERDEELPFFAPTGRNQGIGSFDASTVNKGNRETGKLQLVNGDDYFSRQQLPPVSLMKIDVEGFEKHVIAGLRQTLQRDRPIVVSEITYGNPLSFQSAAEILAALPPDYALYAFNTRKADGSKARKRGGKAKLSGHYEVIPYSRWLASGQDDIIACPQEKLAALPGVLACA